MDTIDVFVSWTSSDRDVKNVLVQKLKDAGLQCWESDREVNSNFAEECIAAIKRSKVFLVLLSDAAMGETFVENEVQTAREMEKAGRLNMVVYKLTDRPYINQFEFLLNHISYVTGNLFQRQAAFGGESPLETLTRRILTLVNKRKDGKPEKPFEVNRPQIKGMKIVPTGYFVEGSRDSLLSAMEEGFQRSNVLILTEFVGFGKRSTIKKFVQRHADQYQNAVTVLNSVGSLRDFLTAGLEFTNLNERVFADLEGDALLEAKLQQLEKLDRNTLLVIPDVTLEGETDSWLCQRLAALELHTIVLTQDSADDYEDLVPVISVGRMRDAHLFTLFFHHYKRAQEEQQEALLEPLAQFFAYIGGHTKTVELTAATLNRELAVTPDELPQYLSMTGSEGLQLKERIIQHIQSIFNTSQLTKEQRSVLLVAACLAVPYMSEKNFRAVLKNCGIDDPGILYDLDQRRWLDVDISNGTVSIEPLVAQVLLSQVKAPYGIYCVCWQYLSDRLTQVFSLSITDSSIVRTLDRIAHFCTVTELPVIADLAREMRKNQLEGSHYNMADMAAVLRSFDELYGTPMEEPETEYYTREDLIYQVLNTVRSGLIPMARMIARGVDKAFLNFNNGNTLIQMTDNLPQTGSVLDFETLFGTSFEELRDMLHMIRESREILDTNDEDSLEYVILMEAVSMMEYMYRQDMTAMQLSALSVLTYAQQQPQLLEDPDAVQVFYMTMQAYAVALFQSQAYSACILLCRQVLAFPNQDVTRAGVLRIYIRALRVSYIYTDELYEAYEEFLRLISLSSDSYENRQDQNAERRLMLLYYAYDLAQGGHTDRAQAQFAAAWKLGAKQDPDACVACAEGLVNALIHNGEFETAIAFLNQYFPEKDQLFVAACSEESQQTIQKFRCYQASDDLCFDNFIDDQQEKKSLSYYREYDRRNNPIWEHRYCAVADKAMDLDYSDLSNEELAQQAAALKKRARREAPLHLAPEAFALASEAGYRVLGYRHHHVQYMGAAAMVDGKVAEILNGEGKTYTIVLVAFLQSLYHKNVFVVDEAEHLIRRNFHWMRGVYDLLGVPCHLGQRPDGQGSVDMPPEVNGVIYVPLRVLLFSYLDFEISPRSLPRSAFSLDAVIVDEADTTLVDYAAQPYAFTTLVRNPDILHWHNTCWELAQKLLYDEEYYMFHQRSVRLKPKVYPLLENTFGLSYSQIQDLPKLKNIENILCAAITCCGHYTKNKDYFISNGMPVKEDRARGVFTAFTSTYAYFLCLENGLNVRHLEQSLSSDAHYTTSIGLKDFFRMFRSVSGTTATAASYRKEFKELYGLEYFAVAPHIPCRRKDHDSICHLSMASKDKAIVALTQEASENGQPVMLITQSVEESEKYSRLLKRKGIQHQVLNAKNANDASDILSRAGIGGFVLVSNALAGRGADIKLGGNPQLATRLDLAESGEDVSALDSFLYTLPTPEQREMPIFKKYHSLLEKNKALCASERQAVLEAGGLCVICTGFFTELRSEQQCRGRSGRQGDVGESWVIWSIEDESARQFFKDGLVDFYHRAFGTEGEFSSKAMDRAIRNAQQTIHDQQFKNIRNLNDKQQFLAMARESLLGQRLDLVDETVTVEELMLQWAGSKPVQQALQRLQKGERSCGNSLLEALWPQYPQLHKARGSKLTQLLTEAALEQAKNRLVNKENPDLILVEALRYRLRAVWESYVNLVEQTVGVVDMKEQALKNLMQTEAQRLLLEAVESVLQLRLR